MKNDWNTEKSLIIPDSSTILGGNKNVYISILYREHYILSLKY